MKRKRGIWFRLTKAEEEEIERLMAEAEAWKPGTPPPERSMEEHLAGLQLMHDDIKARQQRYWLFFALFLLAWAALIGLQALTASQ